jgi:hypothetical protein
VERGAVPAPRIPQSDDESREALLLLLRFLFRLLRFDTLLDP